VGGRGARGRLIEGWGRGGMGGAKRYAIVWVKGARQLLSKRYG